MAFRAENIMWQRLSEKERHKSTKRKRSPSLDRPNMSELRIVLLGKSLSENSRLGNSILGINVWDREHPLDYSSQQNHSVRISGSVENRHISVINSANLLQLNLSQSQITERVKECISVCAPGPHAFILVLQHQDFSEGDRNRVKHVLNEVSEEAMKRTIVLTTDKETYRPKQRSVIENEHINHLIEECEGRYIQMRKRKWLSDLLTRVDEIIKKETDEYLKCEIYEGTSVDVEPRVHASLTPEEEEESSKESHEVRREDGNIFLSVKSKLNVVLCGADATLKVSVSKLLRGKLRKPLNQKVFSSPACVKKEETVDGRQICVVALPALTGLSDEEVVNQTLSAVSLCDPGVHVFLIIVPVGPLTDEHKEEMEKIQKIFNSTEHFMMIFTSDVPVDRNVTEFVESNTECQRLIRLCGGRYRVIGLKEHEKLKPISTKLLHYIENMKTDPYSLQVYARAQEKRVRLEAEEKYEAELSELKSKIKELQEKINSDGAEGEQEDLRHLRIVLIGRTGSGKSATGNTILGQNEFKSLAGSDSVTTVCEKGVGEVDGRSVAVVDTPGLFDTTMTNDKVIEEIMKCVSLSSPGPHAFIIVLSVGRFTQEESETVDLIKKIFGPKVAQFSIVLFTRGDDLQDESIEDFVKRSKCEELKKLIRDCGDRFLVFNNREKQDRSQVTGLINMIEDMKRSKHGQYFTNSMFEEAEMSIKKKMEEILREKEREIQTQKEEIKASYEAEMEQLKKKLEEERLKIEEDRLKTENLFSQKEENLRKTLEEQEKKERLKREKEKQKQLEEEEKLRAEHLQKIEEMRRESEHQRSLYEQQQREREEDERKKEEKYRQDQENKITKLKKRQEEEIKKRETEEQKRSEQEEREREEWRIKTRDAENDRKETQEKIKRQQREWEEEKKRQMRERKEAERKRKEKHEEQLREKQEELEKMREKFEKEREEERRKLRKEKEERKREYEEKRNKMMKLYEQLERERKEMWERLKQEEDERREEERKRWEKRIEYIKREQEEELKRKETQERERKEREEKERKEMKDKHEWRMKEMKKKHEDEARKQAEEINEFKENKNKHVEELEQMLEERQKHELLEKLHHLEQQKGEEVEKLQKEVEGLKNKSSCVLM